MTELLPCPFCGSTNIDAKGWRSLDAQGPACDDCGASAGQISLEHADNVNAWNTRTPKRVGDAKCRCDLGDIFQCVFCAEAASNPLLGAATWAAENYENININHVDYRVEVKRRMDDAIAKARGEVA